MKPDQDKRVTTTVKKNGVTINPKKEDLMQEKNLDEKKLDPVGKEDKTSTMTVTMISLISIY